MIEYSRHAISDDLVGGYGQSLTNLFGQHYPSVRVGVRITLPFKNRTAEANLGRSLAEGPRIKDQRAQLEQLIETDVRNAIQALRSGEARPAAVAASARETAEQQYLSEQRRFQAGSSTVFLVLERQTSLVAARRGKLQAETDLNQAIAEFQRSTASTFEANNISVITDAPARNLRMVDSSGKDLTEDFRDDHLSHRRPAHWFGLRPSFASGSSVRRQEQ